MSRAIGHWPGMRTQREHSRAIEPLAIFPTEIKDLLCGAAVGLPPMPIHELLRRQDVFTPEEVTVLGNAFEDVLQTLGLIDRKDPMTETVAKKLVDLATAGVRDPERLKHLTVQAFSELFRPHLVKLTTPTRFTTPGSSCCAIASAHAPHAAEVCFLAGDLRRCGAKMDGLCRKPDTSHARCKAKWSVRAPPQSF